MYDRRVGRWLSTNPEGQFASPYEGMGNSPANSMDINGGLIIFVNGMHAWNGLDDKYNYWGDVSDKIQQIYNDRNIIYADGRGSLLVRGRVAAGSNWTELNLMRIIKAQQNGEKIIIVSHSMGTAFAEGIQSKLAIHNNKS